MRLAQFLLLFRCEIPDVTDFGGVEGHFMTSEKDLARSVLYGGENTDPCSGLAAFFRRLTGNLEALKDSEVRFAETRWLPGLRLLGNDPFRPNAPLAVRSGARVGVGDSLPLYGVVSRLSESCGPLPT